MNPLRLNLASWVILPLLLVWTSTNYLIGINKHIPWEQNNAPVVLSNQVMPQKEPPKIKWNNTGLITLWFDDAWSSQFSVAYPLLEEEGLVAALAVPTQLVNFDGYMSWNQIELLQYKGWEITAHTRTHNCDTNKLNEQFLENELNGSKQDLAEHGIYAQNYVSPCGIDSTLEEQIAKKYYLSLRTSFSGVNPLPVSKYYHLNANAVESGTTTDDIRDWIQEASDTKGWLIIMFHQLDAEGSKYSMTPDKFREIIEVVKESELPVVLPSQALQVVVEKE